ncbi:hypothetical protein K443DRAFT_111186, partial [Laccaria amethystina LaAM-08-1]
HVTCYGPKISNHSSWVNLSAQAERLWRYQLSLCNSVTRYIEEIGNATRSALRVTVGIPTHSYS